MIGPTMVPRPPTAVQITTSIELAGSNSPGLMIPTWGTYSAPAMPAITAETVKAKSFTYSTLYPRNRVRLSASRTAIITLPSLELTIIEQMKTDSASAMAVAAKSALRVVLAWTGTPRISLKSVSPLLPPKPMSLRKKASISAKVIAWVMIER